MLGYTYHTPDWYYRWNEGRNILSVSLPWRYWLRFWWSKGDREGISAVFVLCLHFRDIWRGEPNVLICGHTVSTGIWTKSYCTAWSADVCQHWNLQGLLWLMWDMYISWNLHIHMKYHAKKFDFYCLMNSWIEGQAVFSLKRQFRIGYICHFLCSNLYANALKNIIYVNVKFQLF